MENARFLDPDGCNCGRFSLLYFRYCLGVLRFSFMEDLDYLCRLNIMGFPMEIVKDERTRKLVSKFCIVIICLDS